MREPSDRSNAQLGRLHDSDASHLERQSGVERIHADVAVDLLERLPGKEPGFFEQAVVQLLPAMGYGGTGSGSGSVTHLSNDG